MRIEARDPGCLNNNKAYSFHIGLNEAKDLEERGIGSKTYADLRRAMCEGCPIGCPRRSVADAVKADSLPQCLDDIE